MLCRVPATASSACRAWPRLGVQHLQHRLPGQRRRGTAKERGGGVQRVLGTDPDDIEEQAVGLARIGARPPPEHLLVQGQALGRAGHDDAIDGGFVKAFGEHGTVGHHPRGAGVQALEDGPAGRQRRGGVQGLRRESQPRRRWRPWHTRSPPWG